MTGDHEAAARTVATSIGVDDVIAAALPADKVAAIRRPATRGSPRCDGGRRHQRRSSSCVRGPRPRCRLGYRRRHESADLIIMRDNLTAVPTAIALARRTYLTIRTNLLWAFGYNVVAIPLAAFGFLNPLIAGAAMALSSGCVVWNSSRLRHFSANAVARRAQPSVAVGALVQPSWLAGSLAAVMMAVAVFSGVRLVAGYARYVSVARGRRVRCMLRWHCRWPECSNANLTLIPGSAWSSSSLGSAVWFAGRSWGFWQVPGAVGGLRRGRSCSRAGRWSTCCGPCRCGPDGSLICGAHMVGMTSSGMTPAKLPALGLVLVALLFGEAVLLAQRLPRGAAPRDRAATR